MQKKILVLSDTHIKDREKFERLYQIIEKFALPVDMIVHAGDAVNYAVYKYLQELAPLKAVCGNVDDERIRAEYSLIETFDVNGKHIALTHGHQHISYGGDPWFRFEESFIDTDLVIFGHTHKPLNQTIGKIRYFNPGSPTDKRTNPYFSLGMLRISDPADVSSGTPATGSISTGGITSEIIYFDKDLNNPLVSN